MAMYHGCTKARPEWRRILSSTGSCRAVGGMDDHDLRGWVSAPLLDVNGLARRLGVTVRFVRQLVEERRVPYLKVGRFVRFDPDEIERWLAATRVEMQSPRWRRR